ncbi:MAG: hypothetical protein KIT84_41595 [Labilithrix sp.]|nr:hypothetical protein [Labilithrix sp.]MCW5817567.1 hypothetical protein [Labilithrix sp.]
MAEVELPDEEEPPRSGQRSASSGRREVAPRDVLATLLPPKDRVDLTRRLIAPVVLAVIPVWWVVDATKRATLTTIGRDQGIFQYVAWALMQGDVDYRDVRDVNGPLTHLIHMLMLRLGGADEHRFHVLDMIATGVTFALAAYLLPGVITKKEPPRLERLAWAAAGWVVLAGQYGLYLYWNQAQRESFCDWFLLPSLALQAARPGAKPARRIVVVAALSSITWFCKPTFVLFTLMQLGVLLVDREVPLARRARVRLFALGAALGGALPLLFLLRYGDVVAFVKIMARDVPQMYRFIWPKSPQEILGEEGPLGAATLGLAVSAALAALVAMRELPRRVLVLAAAPVVGLAVVLVQAKGFGYHFHPLTASAHLGLCLVVLYLWERFRHTSRKRPLGRLVALAAAAALGLFVASNMRASTHTRNYWILAGGETPERRQEKEYFDTFKTYDFFPWEMRQAASYLAETTAPTARVQVYGMDPYLLFLAERRSATPYILAYDLNVDAALEGGWGAKPDWKDVARIVAGKNERQADMLARLQASPPEAFVFIDRAPLISFVESAWDDFRYCCMEAATWVAANYHAARSFGDFHVWLRDDSPVPDQAEGQMWP